MAPAERESLERLGVGDDGHVIAFLSRLHRESSADRQALTQAQARIVELEKRDGLSSAIRFDGEEGSASTVGDLDLAISQVHSDLTQAQASGHVGKQEAAVKRLESLQRQRYS